MIDLNNPDYVNTPASANRPRFDYVPGDADERPLVSIITPFYNTGAEFHETARSVYNQSLQQWEWLIVNDGTAQTESLAVLNEFRSQDARVHVIDLAENRGLSAARNAGIDASRSEFCLLLDSDDLLEPTTAEKWLWFLITHPEYSFVSSNHVCFGATCYPWHGGFIDEMQNLERNRIACIVMIRRESHQRAGGFDETMRLGLEDWEYWVRSAAKGMWGATLPEYLVWIRTRDDHTLRWNNLREEALAGQRAEFRRLYPQLWEGAFPQISQVKDLELATVPMDPPFPYHLGKHKPRLLLIAPWLVMGGAEKFNLDLVNELIQVGWEITVATTAPAEHAWRHLFEALTPDVFTLDTFLDWQDVPRFLVYLARSRQVDAIFLASSLESYRLLPYLRKQLPNVAFLDYLHMISPDWMNGGVPRLSLLYQQYLNLTMVSSQSIKSWMVERGVNEEKIQVCTINVDEQYWSPDERVRTMVRAEMNIPSDQFVILFIARLEAQKQPSVFGETMFQLHELGVGYQAFVIGDGSLRNELEQFVVEKGLEKHIHVLGTLPLPRVRTMMQMGDVVFLPSSSEGISKAFYEGMACGLVPIGSAVGGQPELVTETCGVLLPNEKNFANAAGFANVLASLANNPEMRKQMSVASRQRIAQYFRLDQMGQSLLAGIGLAQERHKHLKTTGDWGDSVGILTRQTIEYLRAYYETRMMERKFAVLSQDYSQLQKKYSQLVENPPIPMLPFSSYLYLTVRALFFPLYSRFNRSFGSVTEPLKHAAKHMLFKEKKP